MRSKVTVGRRWSAALVATCSLAVAACTVDPGVAVEDSNQSGAGPVVPDGQAGFPPTDSDDTSTPESGDPVVERPDSDVTWGSCDAFGIPSVDDLGTSGWECSTLVAPMDPFGSGTTETVELALTRHPATGDRRGTILLNPGGPGGAGLPLAWNVRGGMPPELLRGFDIVSWDPRGIGYSQPSIRCDDEQTPGGVDYIARCVELTGTLSSFVSAPYSAADMEAIRVALGEDTLDYLGYSYGSILGATYAAEHPERVGAFVLDGVTDPLAGSTDGPFDGTFAVFADDGRDAALARFAELCDATDACLATLDAADIIDALSRQVPALTTDFFDSGPDRIGLGDYSGFLDAATTFAGDWELVATALEDADRGDASAMAAMIASDPLAAPSDTDDDDGGGDDGDGEEGPTDVPTFSEANFMIYCSDLGPLLTGAAFCDDMTPNERRMQAVDSVDVERDILVIGTEYDPLTPGYHAPDFVKALGSATHVIWEGVGHTAFPGWTPCIDETVTDQFLRRSLPDDGTRCSFLAELDSDEEIADELFGQGDVESRRRLEFAIERTDPDSDSTCVAQILNQDTAQVISHAILDVTSPAATSAVTDALAKC